MGGWKNEDDIKAELRILTDELRHLREELRDMVAPPKQNPSRAFLHRRSWSGAASAPSGSAGPPRPADVVGSADERKRPGARRHAVKTRGGKDR
jgi:hypothetical protein